MKILVVAGARPNFVKVAPILKELGRRRETTAFLVHTGQHYDVSMAGNFFRDLGIPEPDVSLEVGSGSHAFQTAEVIKRIEPVLLEERPAAVVVVGDVNSTMAAALAAVKLQIPVAHVEAGLRSFDRTMPEEINRVVTDSISDFLFVSEQSGLENLAREGVEEAKVFFVGNVMIDSLEATRALWMKSDVVQRLGLTKHAYGAMTLHRPSNVDDAETFTGLVGVLSEIAERLPLVFPVHPRTVSRIKEFGLENRFRFLDGNEAVQEHGLHMVPAMGYLDFLALEASARLVLTDSGGVQEESTILGVPCLTLRENTERPATITHGTNRIVGTDPARIRQAALEALDNFRAPREMPPLWDGRAAQRIVDGLAKRIAQSA